MLLPGRYFILQIHYNHDDQTQILVAINQMSQLLVVYHKISSGYLQQCHKYHQLDTMVPHFLLLLPDNQIYKDSKFRYNALLDSHFNLNVG